MIVNIIIIAAFQTEYDINITIASSISTSQHHPHLQLLPVPLRIPQVFVSPRQWTDHWRHCRGGRQASVNLAVCRDLFPWSIKSAPPLIPFDTPVMGMAQSELQPTNPSRPALQRLVMLCYCLCWKMMVIWRWWWWGCGDNDCEDGDLVMKTMILRMMMVRRRMVMEGKEVISSALLAKNIYNSFHLYCTIGKPNKREKWSTLRNGTPPIDILSGLLSDFFNNTHKASWTPRTQLQNQEK